MEENYEVPSFFYSPVFIIACIALFVFLIAAQWRVFQKAGQPGWACIIPIYNIYIMTKIAGKPGIWTLWCLIPIVNFIFAIWLLNMISKSFGHGEGFTLGLLFLSIIFWPILGFGSSRYHGPYGDPAAFHAYREKSKFDFEQPK